MPNAPSNNPGILSQSYDVLKKISETKAISFITRKTKEAVMAVIDPTIGVVSAPFKVAATPFKVGGEILEEGFGLKPKDTIEESVQAFGEGTGKVVGKVAGAVAKAPFSLVGKIGAVLVSPFARFGRALKTLFGFKKESGGESSEGGTEAAA